MPGSAVEDEPVMADRGYPDFDDMIERTHRSVDAVVAGNPEPQKRLWSRSDDVTLANPLGGYRRGWQAVQEEADRAAGLIQCRSCVYEEVARFAGSDVAYVFEIERTKLTGREGTIALRVTMIFRLEEGEWKLVHRQADPLTESQPLERSIQEPS
jgi:ketosteroid isomerase-like protein